MISPQDADQRVPEDLGFAIYEEDFFSQNHCPQYDLELPTDNSNDFSSVVEALRQQSLQDARVILAADGSSTQLHFPNNDAKPVSELANIFWIQQSSLKPCFKFAASEKGLAPEQHRFLCECFYEVDSANITFVNRGPEALQIFLKDTNEHLTMIAFAEMSLSPQRLQITSESLSVSMHIFSPTWHHEKLLGEMIDSFSPSDPVSSSFTLAVRPKTKRLDLLPDDAYQLSFFPSPARYGGSCSSFSAHHSQKGIVAVNFYTPRQKFSVTGTARLFLRDIGVYKKAVHPFILGFKGFDSRMLVTFTEPGVPVLFLQMDAERKFTQRQDFPKICISIASAITFLHQTLKMKHSQISASSIRLANSRYVLADIQSATRIDEKKNTLAGVLQYIPPEYDIRKHPVDEKGDIFALGTVFAYSYGIIALPFGEELGSSWSNNLKLQPSYDKRRLWHQYFRDVMADLKSTAVHNMLRRLLADEPEDRMSAEDLFETACRMFPEQAEQWRRSVKGKLFLETPMTSKTRRVRADSVSTSSHLDAEPMPVNYACGQIASMCGCPVPCHCL